MNEKYRNVLITGGAGNLGRHCYYELCHDYDVTLFDRVKPEEQRAPWFPNRKYARFVQGNLDSLEDCMRAITVSKADVILHIAGIPYPSEILPSAGYNYSIAAREDETFRTNVTGTYYLLDAARRLGVKKVIFASTFFVTGIGNRISGTEWPVHYVPIDEEHPIVPEDSYSYSKLLGEEMLKAYSLAYGIKTVAFRLMGISYPYRPHLSPIEIPVMEACKDGFYEGHSWQYVDARDVAQCARLAIEKDLEKNFEAFHIITDKRYSESTVEFAKTHWPTIADQVAAKPEIFDGPEDRGLFTDKKLRDMLGYHEKYSWRQGENYPHPDPNDPTDQD